jgi:hypothetical protein
MLLKIVVMLGLILYPITLWFTYDLYALGFNSILLPVSLSGGAVILWKNGYRKLAILILVAIWAWLLNLSASQNLWDYVINGWLVIYASFHLIIAKFILKQNL